MRKLISIIRGLFKPEQTEEEAAVLAALTPEFQTTTAIIKKVNKTHPHIFSGVIYFTLRKLEANKTVKYQKSDGSLLFANKS